MSKNNPLSPSVVQLFSMSSSISTVTSDPSDSGIESIKSSKHSHHSNFRARGNSDIAYKKQYKNNNVSNHHTNNNNIKFIKTRASSLSPTKNIIMTPKQHNINNTPNSPQTAKKMTKVNKQQQQNSQLLPPRFSMKKQVSAPASNSSYKPTAINKSEPTFRNKKLTSTAMNRKLNTPLQHNNTDSNNNKNGNLSDSGSSKSEARSSKSTKSNKSEKSSSNKKFCRTANFVNAGNNNNQHQRQRNNDSFCGTVFKDEMWAGSAAPPDATALPKPPTDWIAKMSLKPEEKEKQQGELDSAAIFENKKSSKASAKPTTTKQPPLANSVQQMFASFNPLVSTTA